ncbi:MAG TPA: hypothetical protein VH394_09355 [Thermoanaerobaculia bacterium]|jgi:hypothetical protein|nr:hypothetical protein [Thermoanaerobaculia bacterium]
MAPRIDLGLNAVIVAVTEEVPRILTVRPGGGPPEDALPFGLLEPELDRTLDRGLRRWVAELTGLPLGYVEQLYTFGDRNRDPAESHAGPRLVSVAYLALVQEASVKGEASWRDWYEFFPWEDRRHGRPAVLDRDIVPALEAWVAEAPQARRERADIAFGLGGAHWDPDRVLERYELLYEIQLVAEARRDRAERASEEDQLLPGRPMILDHRRILATALGRLRGKIRYRPVVFELLPPTFTLLQLQTVVEALTGTLLHKQNFRRLVEHNGLVEGTGQDVRTGGRPAELFRFRRNVLRERPAPGVGRGALKA